MSMLPVEIIIPPGVEFSALALSRTPMGVRFDWRPLEAVCAANGIDPALLRSGSEDNVSALIEAWYRHHRSAGGARDETMDSLIAQVLAEVVAEAQPHDIHPSASRSQ